MTTTLNPLEQQVYDYCQKARTAKDVQRYIDRAYGTTMNILSNLVSKGLLSARESEGDRRRKIYFSGNTDAETTYSYLGQRYTPMEYTVAETLEIAETILHFAEYFMAVCIRHQDDIKEAQVRRSLHLLQQYAQDDLPSMVDLTFQVLRDRDRFGFTDEQIQQFSERYERLSQMRGTLANARNNS